MMLKLEEVSRKTYPQNLHVRGRIDTESSFLYLGNRINTCSQVFMTNEIIFHFAMWQCLICAAVLLVLFLRHLLRQDMRSVSLNCVTLYPKLAFDEYLYNFLKKVNKEKFITKVSINYHIQSLDYGDILYDQIYNSSFYEKLESIQYNVCLALKAAMRDSSK